MLQQLRRVHWTRTKAYFVFLELKSKKENPGVRLGCPWLTTWAHHDFRGRTTAARTESSRFHSCILLPIIGLIRGETLPLQAVGNAAPGGLVLRTVVAAVTWFQDQRWCVDLTFRAVWEVFTGPFYWSGTRRNNESVLTLGRHRGHTRAGAAVQLLMW